MLGLKYNLKEDEIRFEVKLAYKQRLKGGRTEEAKMSTKEVESLKNGTMSWSRCKALSFLMGVYDPLQILSPVMLQGKLLLRRTLAPPLGPLPFDNELPAKEKIRWGEWMLDLLADAQTSLKRSVTP